ncbi:MAG: glycosyltransferase family 39 protein [Chloroflexi bacterium]|nr:glycosyltransferase family 39 protein [Chloroflexota bacterium]
MSDESRIPKSEFPQEPSVLDYVKSKLFFWRGQSVEIPAQAVEEKVEPEPQSQPAEEPSPAKSFPWISLIALGIALFAQRLFEPPVSSAIPGITFYVAALGLLLIAVLRGEWTLAPLVESTAGSDPMTFRRNAFLISLPLAIFAFFLFSGNLFNLFNLTIWLIAIGLFVWSLWIPDPNKLSLWQRTRNFLAHKNWQINISRWTLLIIAAAVIVFFFRVYHIQQTPSEPFSDHAEKILDIYDILHGQPHIFFPRNTGREAIGMYWIVLTVWIFNTGLSFLTTKIATISMGLVTLPYIYLLGKEIANRRVGLLAFFLAGIAYWPNVISRIGLRFPLYPLFVAPMMLYLIRGLRTGDRNQFIIAGIFLGLGLNGYTPYRIVPFLVIAAMILFALHIRSKTSARDALVWLTIVGLVSLFIFLPLMRYATENPEGFSFRAFSRLGEGQAIPGPILQVFFSNLWNGLKMFNWDDGNIWVNSLPHRPALDVVSGALFLIGIVLLIVRYIRKRNWLDLFLLLSIPILLMPSILSLAFPDENPALNRASGAFVPVFIVVAMALDGFIAAFGSSKNRTAWAAIITGVLLLWSASQNFDIVFHQFDTNYRLGAWNSSEMGAVIKEFGLVYGETDTVWIVPFPYWVDTRLPGVWAGIPNRDFAMPFDQLASTTQISGPKLFIVKASLDNPEANDQQSLDALKLLYPQGTLSLHKSPVPDHDFWIYFVPAPTTP